MTPRHISASLKYDEAGLFAEHPTDAERIARLADDFAQVWAAKAAEARAAVEPVASLGVYNVLDYGDLATTMAFMQSGATVWMPDGEHVITATIPIQADYLRIVASPGAVIRLDPALPALRVFQVHQRRGVQFQGLRFVGPSQPAARLPFRSSVIDLSDAVACEVAGCTFDLTGHSSDETFADAVVVRGGASVDNRICGNMVRGAGLNYSYAGASRTTCAGNTIIDAPENGLTANGNAGSPADCRITGNTIANCGRIAIEDGGGGVIDRTIIAENIILNPAHMGISAIGRDTLVAHNTVQDSPDFGIETGGRGVRVLGNTVRQSHQDLHQTGTGIMVNDGDEGAVSGAIVTGNMVSGFNRGIQTYHNPGEVVIGHNHVTDCATDYDFEV